MKSFLEEYGFAILAAIVVILLIAMCTPVGNLIKNQITSVVDSFASKTTSKLDSIDAGDVSVAVVQDSSDTFTLTVTANSTTDEFALQYKERKSSESFNDKTWFPEEEEEGTMGNADLDKGTKQVLTYEAKGEKGSYIKFRVINIGTGEVVFESSEYVLKKSSK